MRRLKSDILEQRLLSGESERPLKSGIPYKKYSKVQSRWSSPGSLNARIWFDNGTRRLKVRADASHLYSFDPETTVTTTTSTTTSSSSSTSSSSTLSTTSSSLSTTTTTV